MVEACNISSKGNSLKPIGLKAHVSLACNLWSRLMAGKIDCLISDVDKALDYAVDVRILLDKHDDSGIVRRLFTGEIDGDEWAKTSWWMKRDAAVTMCNLRIALHQGGYGVSCSSKRRYKCRECPLL